jgi:hypothetical protein
MEGLKVRGYLFESGAKDPCITCDYFRMCRHGYACKAFVSYVRTGKYNEQAPKNPTRLMYEKFQKEEL